MEKSVVDIKPINVMTSTNQSLRSEFLMIGTDTEMLLLKDGKVLWPDEVHLPQKRDPTSSICGDGSSSFDFHGDGFATELCTQAASCLETMLTSIASAWRWLDSIHGSNKLVLQNFDPSVQNLAISTPAIYDVPAEIVTKANEETKRLGCMPSLNIYDDCGNPDELSDTQRTTGCHLHVSHSVLDDTSIGNALVQWADILVGCSWTYISPNDPKDEVQRRKAYGRAGEFRRKVYGTKKKVIYEGMYGNPKICEHPINGVEYRVLPGTALVHPVYFTLMFNLYRNALHTAANFGMPPESLALAAQEAINGSNSSKAMAVLKQIPFEENSLNLINYLHRHVLDASNLSRWYKLAVNHKGHQYFERELGYRKEELNVQ